MSLLYLLLRYKRELGVKSIESVTIFRDDYDEDKDPEVQLLFRIRNVPSPPDEVVAGRFVERMEETRNFLHEHVIYV